MINITLPHFYFNYIFNTNFINFIEKYPESKSFNYHVEKINGNFPFNFFGGNINCNTDNILLKPEIEDFLNKINKPIELDCSNLYFRDKDFTNSQLNMILNSMYARGHFIKTANLDFVNYLKNNYPFFKIIISDNISLLKSLEEEEIEVILNNPNIFRVNTNTIFKDIPMNKIECNVLNLCQNCQLKKYEECLDAELKTNYLFSKKSIFNNCGIKNNYELNKNLLNEIKEKEKLGIHNINIITPSIFQIDDFNKYLIFNLIKEEYQSQFYNSFQKE